MTDDRMTDDRMTNLGTTCAVGIDLSLTEVKGE